MGNFMRLSFAGVLLVVVPLVASVLERCYTADFDRERQKARRESLERSITKRTQVARDVIAGRLTLLEAAVVFRRTERENAAVEVTQVDLRDLPENERACRMVIRWV